MRLSRHTSLNAAQRYIHVNDDDLDLAYAKLETAERKPARAITTNAAETTPEHTRKITEHSR